LDHQPTDHPIAILTNTDGQLALCGPKDWCLPLPNVVEWYVLEEQIDIYLDDKVVGHTTLEALEDLRSTKTAFLMALDGTRMPQYGLTPCLQKHF
jgi:hypothetical protein